MNNPEKPEQSYEDLRKECLIAWYEKEYGRPLEDDEIEKLIGE